MATFEQTLEAIQRALHVRDQQIRELQDTLQEKDDKVAVLGKALGQTQRGSDAKDQELQALQAELKERDGKMTVLKSGLEQSRLALTVKDQHFQALRMTLKERDGRMTQLQDTIARLESESQYRLHLAELAHKSQSTVFEQSKRFAAKIATINETAKELLDFTVETYHGALGNGPLDDLPQDQPLHETIRFAVRQLGALAKRQQGQPLSADTATVSAAVQETETTRADDQHSASTETVIHSMIVTGDRLAVAVRVAGESGMQGSYSREAPVQSSRSTESISDQGTARSGSVTEPTLTSHESFPVAESQDVTMTNVDDHPDINVGSVHAVASRPELQSDARVQKPLSSYMITPWMLDSANASPSSATGDGLRHQVARAKLLRNLQGHFLDTDGAMRVKTFSKLPPGLEKKLDQFLLDLIHDDKWYAPKVIGPVCLRSRVRKIQMRKAKIEDGDETKLMACQTCTNLNLPCLRFLGQHWFIVALHPALRQDISPENARFWVRPDGAHCRTGKASRYGREDIWIDYPNPRANRLRTSEANKLHTESNKENQPETSSDVQTDAL